MWTQPRADAAPSRAGRGGHQKEPAAQTAQTESPGAPRDRQTKTAPGASAPSQCPTPSGHLRPLPRASQGDGPCPALRRAEPVQTWAPRGNAEREAAVQQAGVDAAEERGAQRPPGPGRSCRPGGPPRGALSRHGTETNAWAPPVHPAVSGRHPCPAAGGCEAPERAGSRAGTRSGWPGRLSASGVLGSELGTDAGAPGLPAPRLPASTLPEQSHTTQALG